MADYLLDLMTLIAILGVAASVVAFLIEEAGIVHVGAAGVMALGAYTVGILTVSAGMSSIFALLATLLVGAVAGVLLHLVTRHLTGDVLALATLAIGIVVHGVILNADAITGGPMGVSGIPARFAFTSSARLDALIFLSLVIVALAFVRASPFGMRVRALREDETLAQDLELEPQKIRTKLWIASSALLSFAGGMFAFHLRYIDPSSFTVTESISILAMALLLSGVRNVGPLVGVLVFVGLPELLRFVGLPAGSAAQLRQLFFGLALLVVVVRGGIRSKNV
jgi:branched-chain amino acid transport system permease protein